MPVLIPLIFPMNRWAIGDSNRFSLGSLFYLIFTETLSHAETLLLVR